MMGMAADKRTGAGVARQEGGARGNGKGMGMEKGGSVVDEMGVEKVKVKDKRLRGLFGELCVLCVLFLISFFVLLCLWMGWNLRN